MPPAYLKNPEASISKLFLISLFAFLLFCPSYAISQITGSCENCHVRYEGETQPTLIKSGCLGCHAQDSSGPSGIITVGPDFIPQVSHRMNGGDLAAGNYRYMQPELGGNSSYGHDVNGVSEMSRPLGEPPGFVGNVILPNGIGPATWPKGRRLECAGTWGCHGDRTKEDPMQALMGAHHGNDGVIDGSTVGRSYRFLLGVKGAEHSKWEYMAAPNNHNGYKGDITYNGRNSIGYLCGQCHGMFYPLGGLGDLSYLVHPDGYYNWEDVRNSEPRVEYKLAWHRHPTEIAFKDTQVPYQDSDQSKYKVYNLSVPMAYAEPIGNETTVDGTSIVTCLTCHRAHASPYNDALRWDYENIEAGVPGAPPVGCRVCHPGT